MRPLPFFAVAGAVGAAELVLSASTGTWPSLAGSYWSWWSIPLLVVVLAIVAAVQGGAAFLVARLAASRVLAALGAGLASAVVSALVVGTHLVPAAHSPVWALAPVVLAVTAALPRR